MRSATEIHDERFRECIALQAPYLYDTFGKIPGTVPSIYAIMCLQAHHLHLDFCDEVDKPEAYLKTHAAHVVRWHSKG